jgi:hypothetical protein
MTNSDKDPDPDQFSQTYAAKQHIRQAQHTTPDQPQCLCALYDQS